MPSAPRDRSPESVVLPYSGAWLDRAPVARRNANWLDAMLHSPQAAVLPLWRDSVLVRGEPGLPVTIPGPISEPVLAVAEEAIFLGLDQGTPLFAADLSPIEEEQARALVGASAVLGVRHLVQTVTASQAATLAYARGMLHWRRQARFCGACGAPTRSADGGHQRVCTRAGCARAVFPRIEPAIITLVESSAAPSRCLIGRHRRNGTYGLLAGFVEIGESLEDAVRREVAEESGLQLDTVTYFASQSWPFPAGLMVGFRARAASATASTRDNELDDLRWITRVEMRRCDDTDAVPPGLGRSDSIEASLIRSWLDEGIDQDMLSTKGWKS